MEPFRLIGLALKTKTTNKDSQAAIDCGNLWQEFEKGNYANKITVRSGDEIFAVYHDYEGDFTMPYSYFIGCKVNNDVEVPPGMDSLIIAGAEYVKLIARGKMPDCVADKWREIWSDNISRAYKADFEIYDDKSKDWNDAEVAIFISVK